MDGKSLSDSWILFPIALKWLRMSVVRGIVTLNTSAAVALKNIKGFASKTLKNRAALFIF